MKNLEDLAHAIDHMLDERVDTLYAEGYHAAARKIRKLVAQIQALYE